LLERVAIAPDDVPKAIAGLVCRPSIREAAILSTCNRTEVYAVAERFHGAYGDIRDFFCELGDLDAAELQPHLYSQHDQAAVAHLFEVAAGLDSALIGESEILGQVRTAWEVAQREGGSGATLNLLFRHAVQTGKRARTETTIGRGTASVSHAAVEMAAERLGSLDGKRVMVIGAGEMGAGIAKALTSAGNCMVTVTSRTTERADTLAKRVGGRTVPFDALAGELATADVLLTCTGSPAPLVDRALLETSRPAGGPLLVVDIAVPRDVDAAVAELADVTVLNLDDLREWAAKAVQMRAAVAHEVHAIVADEVDRFEFESTARQAAPLVAKLRDRADGVRRGELDRFASRLRDLTPEQADTVDALTKAIVSKLLHQASVRLKHDAGSPKGERNAAAVRDLFDLG
ncbi:MAG TPA: glutamyl-tRNA reductase, partial [Ilumatobacteraceae bacterium]|nr:glutamyl-tRNA reductase [Ilumatobacteraceae bacterium]